jgi:hypothetical protein
MSKKGKHKKRYTKEQYSRNLLCAIRLLEINEFKNGNVNLEGALREAVAYSLKDRVRLGFSTVFPHEFTQELGDGGLIIHNSETDFTTSIATVSPVVAARRLKKGTANEREYQSYIRAASIFLELNYNPFSISEYRDHREEHGLPRDTDY